MKYLVVSCRELDDQYECDCDRTPLCCTDDISKYGIGYEIYSINDDGRLSLIKDSDTALSEGMAVYYWTDGQDIAKTSPEVISTFEMNRDQITRSFIKKQIKPLFQATIDTIYKDIQCRGHHNEQVDNQLIVFGEYWDNYYSR